jgi:DNA-damage-inducible protein D
MKKMGVTNMNKIETSHHLVVFKDKSIRRIIHQNEWYFSIIDVIGALSDSANPRRYWSDLKQQLIEKEAFSELYEKIVQLKMEAPDGKKRETDCASTESLFRIIQSVPSPKAEPFKRWLAKVGYERVQEIEDPELASMRARFFYKSKGYSDAWIEKRMRSIAIREELTDEWQRRGVEDQKDYAILTAEITKAAFGMTPTEYKKHKNIKRENLRDHMSDLELIFSMLGEASTTEITRTNNTKGFSENLDAAKQGGEVAGNARKELERKTKKTVVSKQNYLKLSPQGLLANREKVK